MIEIKQRLLKEIDNLTDEDLFITYDIIMKVRNKQEKNKTRSFKNYKKIRNILNKTNKSISDEIMELRDDRI